MPAKRLCLLFGFVSILAAPTYALAQEETPLVYATYYKCDPTREDRADAIMNEAYGPVFDNAVAAESITGWGWIAHHTGGPWRRANYFGASNRDALFDALEEIQAGIGDASDELAAICSWHEDYIWEPVAAAPEGAGEVVTDRTSATHGSYFMCDMSRQARADALFNEALAPIFNRHVGDGELNSWSLWGHHTGGKWRRLLILGGADHKTVQAARQAIINDLESEQAEAMQEFFSICGTHQDYLWDIQIARP